jgi:hypothetical protein
MKTEAEKKINQILADVWGVEIAEPVKTEAEDEQQNLRGRNRRVWF